MKEQENGFFPSRLARKGLQREDVEEFSRMYEIPYEQSIGLMFDYSVSGKPIAELQKKFGEKGVPLTRAEAAHLHFDTRFVNRTQDARPQESRNPKITQKAAR